MEGATLLAGQGAGGGVVAGVGALRGVGEEDLVGPLVVGLVDVTGVGIGGVGVSGALVGNETMFVVALLF